MRKCLCNLPVALLVLAIGACGSEANIELDTDTAAAVDRLEAEIEALGDEVQGSEFSQDLASAWEEMEGELTDMVGSVRTGDAIDLEQIQAQMDQFQQRLESVEVEQSLEDTWSRLRAEFDALMAEVG